MKKIVFIFSILNLLILQSCKLNSEVTYYKDSTSTTTADIDMEEMISSFKSIFADSLQNKKKLEEIEKLPRTWTSMYDLDKEAAVSTVKDPDSIRLMKKTFMKSNFNNNNFTGISFKMDHFAPTDYSYIKKGFSKADNLPVDINTINNWNGKILSIDTEGFNTNALSNSPENNEANQMVNMMYKEIGITLKFENKIKSITGKHDWISKIDDHTVKINYDIEAMSGESSKKLINSDKKVIIVTE